MTKDPDNGLAEEEKKTSALLALLYPEEGAEEAAEAETSDAALEISTLSGDEELASLRSLRSLFRDMPDEEPSDAVTNKLLALAAQHAPEPAQENRGFFAWLSDLFMPLAAHPGLAAAASLLLVAGVAGTLYVSGGAEVVQPTANQNASSDRASASPSLDEEITTTSELGDPSDTAPSPEPAPVIADEAPAEGSAFDDLKERAGSLEKGELPSNSDSSKSRRKAKPATVVGGSVGGKSRASAGKGGSAPLGTISSSSAGPGGSGVSKTGSEESFDKRSENRRVKDVVTKDLAPAPKPERSQAKRAKSPPPPPPPAQSAPSPDQDFDFGEGEAEADDDLADSEEAPAKKGPSAASLHAQAIAAAKKGNCTTVNAIGRKIRTLDSAYYDRKFLSDSRLKACRSAKKK